MSSFNTINYVFAVFFVLIGVGIAVLGLSVLFNSPQNETEWTIAFMSLISAAFLFYGAIQTWQNAKNKQAAEQQEAARLRQKFQTQKAAPKVVLPASGDVETRSEIVPEKPKDEAEKTSPEAATPEILVRWIYPPKEWNAALAQLAKKTKQEEMYTAFWFPVFFAILLWGQGKMAIVYGILGGLLAGFLYIRFRMYWVKKNFTIKPGAAEAEIIVSDSYLRINGNFIHYADGHYYLKELTRDKDAKLGDYLLFNIGWTTSKGMAAQMDVYLPILEGNNAEAELILAKFKAARP